MKIIGVGGGGATPHRRILAFCKIVYTFIFIYSVMSGNDKKVPLCISQFQA